MTLSLYVARQTPVHRLHPLTKLAVLGALVVAAFVVDRPVLLLPLLAGTTALLCVGGGAPLLRRFAPVLALVPVFTIGTWTFFYGRTLDPSRAGFEFGLSMAIRLVTFLVAGLAFLATTRVEEVAWALGRLGVPHVIGFTLTLAFRLVPVFFESAVTILAAQRCRGLTLDRGGPIQRLRRFVPVLVPVFVGALRRADRMAMALELRGLGSGHPRTSMLRPAPGPADWLAGGVALTVVSVYLALWFHGMGALDGAP